ncbi:GRASP55/65 PDZ-like domain-containing protein [Radiomyces spectabilis]|uniref:GRASP55/65 PDZ-like domain-containing protein n=1 Tax=Radiomyces spectabilis TaxID=64574 RepID=UPI00221F2658|nr:GRASP55/65 PDZ-like domain-containing protein [Radiomyces spectabilis]KAI8388423.1 GRASP55/65 PDZ-like domain-containing protein [Radiomyces spectabilis]
MFVFQVKENSPASVAGIEEFFDYIISINHMPLVLSGHEKSSCNQGNTQILLKNLREFEDKPVPLTVYSSKDQETRELTLIPSRQWHTEGEINDARLKYLGCSIRFCSYAHASEHIWHVLEVAPNSPAEMAGLIPDKDFIVGSPHLSLQSEDDLFQLIEEFTGKSLRLYVYNSEWDKCREVLLVPHRDWGGHGSIGCDVGYGLLHRIPAREKRRTSSEHNQNSPQDHSTMSSSIFCSPDFELSSSPALDHNKTPSTSGPSTASAVVLFPSTEDQSPKVENPEDEDEPSRDAILEQARTTELPPSPKDHLTKEQ